MSDITQLIDAAGNGDSQALKDLFVQVYGELKHLARRHRAAGATPTLDTTSLVHEAYIKLTRSESGISVQNRAHFFSLAAKAMRQIAMDHARASVALKRSGGESVELGGPRFSDDPAGLLQLDNALADLADREPELVELVELRYFAGLSVEEISQLRGIPDRTLRRQWHRAKIYLFDAMGETVPS